jgi:hypothetical protein
MILCFLNSDIFPLFRVSYMWYTCLGATFTIVVSAFMTLIYGKNDPRDVPAELIAPQLRRFFDYRSKNVSENVEVNLRELVVTFFLCFRTNFHPSKMEKITKSQYFERNIIFLKLILILYAKLHSENNIVNKFEAIVVKK